MLGVRVPPGLPRSIRRVRLNAAFVVRSGDEIAGTDGHKMAKATPDTTKTDKPVKAGKPGKAPQAAKPSAFQRLAQYLRDVRAEMKRVVWPTRPEVVNSSVVVVTTLLFFILIIAVTDLLVVQILALLSRIGG